MVIERLLRLLLHLRRKLRVIVLRIWTATHSSVFVIISLVIITLALTIDIVLSLLSLLRLLALLILLILFVRLALRVILALVSALAAIARLAWLLCLRLLLLLLVNLLEPIVIFDRAKTSVPSEIFREERIEILCLGIIDIAISLQIGGKIAKELFSLVLRVVRKHGEHIESDMDALMLQQAKHRIEILVCDKIRIISQSEHISGPTYAQCRSLRGRKSVHCRQQDTVIRLLHGKYRTDFLKVHHKVT